MQHLPRPAPVAAAVPASPDGRSTSVPSVPVKGWLAAVVALASPLGAQGLEFSAYYQTPPSNFGEVRFRDFDGDTVLDRMYFGDNGANSFQTIELARENGLFVRVVDVGGLMVWTHFDAVPGDFDGDGDLDIARVGGDDLAVVFMELDASGNYVNRNICWSCGSVHNAYLASGDVDLDGDVDVVKVARGSGSAANTMVVLVNQGGFVFTVGAELPFGPSPNGLALADLDLDGDLDIVAGEDGATSISVSINAGGGVFAPRVLLSAATVCIDPIVTDLDGDGDVDIVASGSGSQRVNVFLNHGDATFAPAASYAMPPASGTASFAVADVDGDGAPDLIGTSSWTGSGVFLNQGSGTFASFVLVSSTPCERIGGQDQDGDGDLDLVRDGLPTLLQRADGTFVEGGYETVSGGAPIDVESGDLDGDGDRDVVVLTGSELRVRLNVDGDLAEPAVWPTAITGTSDLELADVDGDSRLDAVIASGQLQKVAVHFGDGAGGFGAALVLDSGPALPRVAVADLDGDGTQDLVAKGPTPRVAFQRGGASFAPFVAFTQPGAGGNDFVLADFDGDGDVDLATAGVSGITLVPNNGSGTFGTPSSLWSTHIGVRIAKGDFDGDGREDLLFGADVNSFGVHDGDYTLLNQGGGVFGPPTRLEGRVQRMRVDDFDRDGDLDVLSYGSPVSLDIPDWIRVYENDGSGAFAASRGFAVPDAVGVVAFDHDGDGDYDLSAFALGRRYVLENLATAGRSLCDGDGSGAACPCGNFSAPGSLAGCLNSTGNAGKLAARGSASLTSDTLALAGSGMTNSFALYFQGATASGAGAGVVFGDGLRCAGGSVVRLAIVMNVLGASTLPLAGDQMSELGQVTAPGRRVYQAWYRDAATYCTSAGWNLTNGLLVDWRP